MVSTIEKEVATAVNLRKQKKEGRQAYLARLTEGLAEMPKEDFDALSDSARNWYEDLRKAWNDDESLPEPDSSSSNGSSAAAAPDDSDADDTEDSEESVTEEPKGKRNKKDSDMARTKKTTKKRSSVEKKTRKGASEGDEPKKTSRRKEKSEDDAPRRRSGRAVASETPVAQFYAHVVANIKESRNDALAWAKKSKLGLKDATMSAIYYSISRTMTLASDLGLLKQKLS